MNTSRLLALSTLKRIDYHLICLDPTLDFSNPMGRMHANILMTFAQYFVENLSAETRKGLMERKEQGFWLGHLPFGVTRAEPLHGEDPRKLPPVRDTAPVVTDRHSREWSRYDALRYIFERYSEGVSMTVVRQELCDIGFPLSAATISFILRNRFYLGEVPVKDQKNRNQVREWLPGVHEPFIEPELFERARQMRYRSRRGSSRSGWSPTTHVFSGLCVCARCGSRMHCDRGRRSPRLICPTGHKQKACEQPTVKQRKVEEQILDIVTRVSFPDEMIERAVAEAEGYAKSDIARERARLEKRRQRLGMIFLDMEEMTRDDYERQKAEIDMRLQQLRELDRPFDTKSAVVQFMRNLGEWYQGATPDEKQKALSLLFQTITIDGAYVSEVTFTPEADYLLRVLSRSSVWANSNRGTLHLYTG